MRRLVLVLCSAALSRGQKTQAPEAVLSNGRRFPLVGLGVGNLAKESVGAAVEAAVAHHGVRLIDTAMGAENHAVVRDAIKRARYSAWVVTKIWYTHLGYERTRLAIDELLGELRGVPNVAVLIHWPRCRDDIPWMRCEAEEAAVGERYKRAGPSPLLDRDAWVGSWKALEEAYGAGRLAAIGVSNFDGDDLAGLLAAAKVPPHLLQGDVWSYLFDAGLVERVAERNVVFQAYNVMNGVVARRAAAPNAHASLDALARAKGTDVGGLALGALVQMGVAVIPRTAWRFAENSPAAVAAIPALAREELARAEEAMRALLAGRDVEGVVATFRRRSGEPLRLFYRDAASGAAIPAGVVIAAEPLSVSTHPGHTFVAYRGDALVGSYTITAYHGAPQHFEL